MDALGLPQFTGPCVIWLLCFSERMPGTVHAAGVQKGIKA
eukprot:COSAG01_NODE_65180_length_274_cov_0.588571_1_plen_39_part_01